MVGRRFGFLWACLRRIFRVLFRLQFKGVQVYEVESRIYFEMH